MRKKIAITIDVDWAPDCAIIRTALLLVKNHIPSTWFITHKSPAIESLQLFPNLFELGIHPNFSEFSSQGSTPKEVMNTCLRIIPNATIMRSHNLFQSTSLLKLAMTKYKIKKDVSIFTPYQFNVKSVLYHSWNNDILRIPYSWEDDYEMEQEKPNWNYKDLIKKMEGLCIINFHPMHIYLNSSNMKSYNKIKNMDCSLSDITDFILKRYVKKGVGVGSLFKELTSKVSRRNFINIGNIKK
jgi:hypothetical protein